jgi:hypothetical protein
MPLTAHEKDELTQQVVVLLELGEPEALVEALKRMCSHKAGDVTTPSEEAKRWSIAANALMEALATVMASQSPQARKFAEHRAKWSGGTDEHREPDPGVGSSSGGQEPPAAAPEASARA